jgi:hypothetical protein
MNDGYKQRVIAGMGGDEREWEDNVERWEGGRVDGGGAMRCARRLSPSQFKVLNRPKKVRNIACWRGRSWLHQMHQKHKCDGTLNSGQVAVVGASFLPPKLPHLLG